MVDINKFVNVNIQPHISSVPDGTRDTVVLYTNEGSASIDGVYDSLEAVEAALSPAATYSHSLAHARVFFNCGGQKLKLIYVTTLTTDALESLDDDLIVVTSTFSTYDSMKALAAAQTGAEIHKKILVTLTNQSTKVDQTHYLAVKYSTHDGYQMSIAAYLSTINVRGVNTVFDYMFTEEDFLTAESVSDTVYDTLINNNYNVDIELSGKIRNCGGNCKDGRDLVNEYVRIILHQTLAERLVNLLATKIKNADGIGKIYNACYEELELYRRAGYLTTDKIWTDDALIIEVNGNKYTLIERGTALVSGYIVKVLPLSALTDEDRRKHKAPPVYIIIADQYGIRAIDVTGEII